MSHPHDNPVGALLRPAMLAKDVSIPQLAKMTGRSRSYLYGIMDAKEREKSLTSSDLIESIAAALDLEPDDLYAAAGIIPPDIKRDVVTSKYTIRAAREAIARVLHVGRGSK